MLRFELIARLLGLGLGAASSPAALLPQPWSSVMPPTSHRHQRQPGNVSIVGSSAGASCKKPSEIGAGLTGFVISNITDGDGRSRCATVIRPESCSSCGVVFCFHGAHDEGYDYSCATNTDGQGKTFGELAMSSGFALVLLQFAPGSSSFESPAEDSYKTADSGNSCASSDSPEITYWANIITSLKEQHSELDTARVFPMGFSSGAFTTSYASACLRAHHGGSFVTSFATHSTGLFVSQDGEYMPIYPYKYSPSLKACVYDGTADDFYFDTSKELVRAWTAAGNPCEHSWKEGGGHCDVVSAAAMLTCLDDGTGHLYSNASLRNA